MLKDIVNDRIVTHRDAFIVFKSLIEQIERENQNDLYSYHIGMDYGLDAGNGFSRGYQPSEMVVGMGGLRYADVKASWMRFVQQGTGKLPVSDLLFMKILVSIYHEKRHADQYYDIRYNDDKFSRQIAIVDKAFRMNAGYGELNYFSDPREVDAELYGLEHAFTYCIEYFGEKKACDLMCNYMNFKIRNGTSYVHHNELYVYSDAYQMLTDMRRMLDNSFNVQRRYDDALSQKNNDRLALVFRLFPEYKESFINETNGMKQDRLAAAAAMSQEGDSINAHIPGLYGITVSEFKYISISDSMELDMDDGPGDDSDQLDF